MIYIEDSKNKIKESFRLFRRRKLKRLLNLISKQSLTNNDL